ncbi:MAG: DUF2892 domain-containing protein [Halospina sp.]
MTVNIGALDRSIRAIVGVVLVALVFTGPESAWGLIGLIPLATAAMGNCPAYSLIGVNTCKTSNR